MNHIQLKDLALFSAVTLPFLPAAAQQSKPKRPLNIIHIMTDDHSFQTISAYGHAVSKIAPTPNIDRLAKEGMLFTQAFVENSISAPSRATLLTGRYSHQHGQRTLGRGFDTTQTCFPQLLQQAGYQTAIVGKWHLHADPKGFDYYLLLNDQGDYYNPEFRETGREGYVREEGYATTLITDHALEWLEQRDRDKPFCLLLHHKAPHRNWMPEPKYYHLFDDVEIPYPETLFDDYSTRCDAARTQEMSISGFMSLDSDLKVWKEGQARSPHSLRDIDREFARMTPEQQEAWMAAYGPRNEAFIRSNLQGVELVKWKYQQYLKDYLRVIRSVDDQIGRVLDYLDKNDLTGNTIVVYTSDQGFYMGEHGWFDKRFMYEESFRMPLIVRCPELIEPESVCDALVQNIDFAPTYLDLAGVQVPDYMPGTPLVGLFGGETPDDWRDALYYHYYDYPAIHMVRKHDGVRTDRYKLIHFYGQGMKKDKGNDMDAWELYDLQKDPSEIHNVYGDPAYKQVQEELTRRLHELRKEAAVTE